MCPSFVADARPTVDPRGPIAVLALLAAACAGSGARHGPGGRGPGALEPQDAAASESQRTARAPGSRLLLGTSTACLVANDRSLRCYGAYAAEIMALGSVGRLGLGDDVGCALVDGQVLCWGGAYGAPLACFGGLAAELPAEPPQNAPLATLARCPPRAILTDTRASNLWLGSSEACALTDAGLFCWGQAAWLDGNLAPQRSALEPAVRRATSFDIADDHGCLITRSGEVQCFGQNEVGQLGTGDARSSDAPVAVYGVSDARHVAVSEQRSCALDAAGVVHCWGNRGVDTQEIERSAVPVASPVPLESFALGRLSLCGLDSSRRVLCSGSNFRDRIGLGTHVTSRRELTPVVALGLADEVAVSVHYTCARAGDTLRCAGEVPSAAREELAPFFITPSETPSPAVSTPPASQTRCVADEDCMVLPKNGCCAPCSGFRVEELTAVHRNAAGAQRRAACPEPMPCPECVIPPPPAAAKCVQNACVLQPLRSSLESR